MTRTSTGPEPGLTGQTGHGTRTGCRTNGPGPVSPGSGPVEVL